MNNIKQRNFFIKSTLSLLLITVIFWPFVIINTGERGVLMKFGEVQQIILGEGLHIIIPIVNTVEKISVRVQKQEISAEALSKDLQDVFTDVALNWHIIPEAANTTFQQLGTAQQVIDKVINPAIEEVLKAIIAKYTAEEIITKRGVLKAELDNLLTLRLGNYHVAVDDISLVHIHFSERFGEAVEAKQIAEQEAKKAEFIALKAMKQAEAKINLARGETEAQRLIRETLTPDILQKQFIEKWDGKLPKIMPNGGLKFDVSQFLN
ncbi:band 7 protein [Nostoc sp. CENA543]|uniref:prohibitin family protein n=1 Tax=Nostoc sp. CENA543 TaxID=1869241 RepID=UPI000CA3F0EE|nr:prohibitin family protein [Nostoc sp. CENA543]AUT02504.1 band 7 protein [Nostoc sp. CENA543]